MTYLTIPAGNFLVGKNLFNRTQTITRQVRKNTYLEDSFIDMQPFRIPFIFTFHFKKCCVVIKFNLWRKKIIKIKQSCLNMA